MTSKATTTYEPDFDDHEQDDFGKRTDRGYGPRECAFIGITEQSQQGEGYKLVSYLHGRNFLSGQINFERIIDEMGKGLGLNLEIVRFLRGFLEVDSSVERKKDDWLKVYRSRYRNNIFPAMRSLLVESNIDGERWSELLEHVWPETERLDDSIRFQGLVAFLVSGPAPVKRVAARCLVELGDERAKPHLERVAANVWDDELRSDLETCADELDAKLSRRERYDEALELIEEWEQAEDEYDEEAWPEIEESLERDGIRFREYEE